MPAWLCAFFLTMGMQFAGCGPVSLPPTTLAHPLVGTEPYLWASTPGTRIFTMDLAGQGKTYLTDADGSRNPEWTCDGSQILFSRAPDGQPTAFLMNADGGNPHQAMPYHGAAYSMSCNAHYAWMAPDPATGKLMVYVWDTSMGESWRQITPAGTVNGEARISPDGTTVVFSRDLANGHRELFAARYDGGGETQLTFPTDPSSPDFNAPSWSHDGKRIAYFTGLEASPGGKDVRNLGVMLAGGSNQHHLTSCTPEATHAAPGQCADDPTWSPDDSQIAYSDPTDDNTWVIPSVGGAPRLMFPGLFLFGDGGGRRWR